MRTATQKIRLANRLLKEAVAELERESVRMDERLSGLNVTPSSFSQQTAAVYGMTNNELYAAWQRAVQA